MIYTKQNHNRITSILEKKCDGIFHCLYGEDEHFEECKNVFPKEATIQCIENRLPGTIDVTIMAIPCDGILECRDGRDENCDEDKWILVMVVAALFLTTICIYLYLIFIKLPSWKNSIFQDFSHNSLHSKLQHCNGSEMRGNALTKLKVFSLKNKQSLYIIMSPFFRMKHRKNNALKL